MAGVQGEQRRGSCRGRDSHHEGELQQRRRREGGASTTIGEGGRHGGRAAVLWGRGEERGRGGMAPTAVHGKIKRTQEQQGKGGRRLHLFSSRGNREGAGRVEPMEEQGVAPWLESACSKGARPFAAVAGGVHGGWPRRGATPWKPASSLLLWSPCCCSPWSRENSELGQAARGESSRGGAALPAAAVGEEGQGRRKLCVRGERRREWRLEIFEGWEWKISM
uniref:Uncharacterized protein n=1 Tax=Zea mays TaxID=4577 RepID=A0A804N3M4_MAIZE